MTLDEFLEQWDADYRKRAEKIPMFDPRKPLLWTWKQWIYFVRVFYHVRGHFNELVWHLGNMAPTAQLKRMFLANIADEWGLGVPMHNLPSHEELYYRFAGAVGLDREILIEEEVLREKTYLPFIRKFNHGHIERLKRNSWIYAFALFAAYERLDNGDYARLLKFVTERRGIPGWGRKFFEVHAQVRHFEPTREYLETIWEDNNTGVVREAFKFIADHQLAVTRKMNAAVNAYRG